VYKNENSFSQNIHLQSQHVLTLTSSYCSDRFVDGAAVARHRYEHFTNGGIAKLYIGRAAVDDSGLYHCRLQNDYGIAETEGQIEVVACNAITRLYMGHATVRDSGLYHCQLSNQYGTKDSAGRICVVSGI